MGIVKGAILLDINNFNIFLSLRLSSLSPYGTPCCQVRAILCGSYVFGFYLQVILAPLEGDTLLTQEEECKGLFEGLQTELEEVTEALAEVIAR